MSQSADAPAQASGQKRVSAGQVQAALLTGLLALLVLIVPERWAAPAPQQRQIRLTARSFSFEPAVVRVNLGDEVMMTLESVDVVHGLYIDGYDLKSQEVEPGRSTQFRFVADRSGKFKLRCSVSCGNLHPFMIGELVVSPNLPFWRAAVVTIIVAAGATIFFSQVRKNP